MRYNKETLCDQTLVDEPRILVGRSVCQCLLIEPSFVSAPRLYLTAGPQFVQFVSFLQVVSFDVSQAGISSATGGWPARRSSALRGRPLAPDALHLLPPVCLDMIMKSRVPLSFSSTLRATSSNGWNSEPAPCGGGGGTTCSSGACPAAISVGSHE